MEPQEPTPTAEVPAPPAVENVKAASTEDTPPKFGVVVNYLDGTTQSFDSIDSTDVDHTEQIVILKEGDPADVGARMFIIPVHGVRYINVVRVG